MEIRSHTVNGLTIAEVTSDATVIATPEDGLDLVGNLNYQGFDRVILHAKNIAPEFFDLRSRLAGEVLQKFTNYRVHVAIVGDFSSVESKSLRDFISESNKGTQVNFVGTVEEAMSRLK